MCVCMYVCVYVRMYACRISTSTAHTTNIETKFISLSLSLSLLHFSARNSHNQGEWVILGDITKIINEMPPSPEVSWPVTNYSIQNFNVHVWSPQWEGIPAPTIQLNLTWEVIISVIVRKKFIWTCGWFWMIIKIEPFIGRQDLRT